MFQSFVTNLKDMKANLIVSESLVPTLSASTMLEAVKERSIRVTEAFRSSSRSLKSNFGQADGFTGNLRTYSDRMATIIDHVRRGYDRDDQSTDIPDSLFDSDEDTDYANGNSSFHQSLRSAVASDDDDDAFLKRLRWPTLTESQVDAILTRLDEQKEKDRAACQAAAAKKASRHILKIVEIPPDDDVNHNSERAMVPSAGACPGVNFQNLPSPNSNHGLQICFMNEFVNDSDEEEEDQNGSKSLSTELKDDSTSDQFWRRHARLQAEARVALAQASHLARMRIEADRYRKRNSTLSEMISLPQSCYGHRRLNRRMLSKLTVSELDSVHTSLAMEIRRLNEELVTSLMKRDELFMGQDSMLVDLEDITRHLQAKERNLHRAPIQNPQQPQSLSSTLMEKASSFRFSNLKTPFHFHSFQQKPLNN